MIRLLLCWNIVDGLLHPSFYFDQAVRVASKAVNSVAANLMREQMSIQTNGKWQ